MVFNVRESIRGFKHLRLKWGRQLRGQGATYYLDRIDGLDKAPDIKVLPADGATCEICGYALLRLEFHDNWIFETCSAMPVIKDLTGSEFRSWLASLPDSSRPAESEPKASINAQAANIFQ